MKTTINWKNPYKNKGRFRVKGNLHTHTNISHCGKVPPEEVLGAYEKMGYKFISINDHRVVSDLSRIKTKLILLPGIEIDFYNANHMCVVGLNRDNIRYNSRNTQQKLINDNINKGNLVVLNHPDWELKEHYPMDKLFSLKDYSGIEIYNSVIERLYGAPVSTAKWDRLLTSGRKVLGFANQDSHLYEDYKDCCNIVNVKKITAENIFNSLKTGNFYCYYGVEILDVGRRADTIYIKTKNARLIRFIGLGGKVLRRAGAKEAEFKFSRGDPYHAYIRIECLGVAEEMSWTQAFFR